MKTVVINTSKEAKNTKLDILFKAPFDRNSLLWFDGGLEDLKGDPERIVQNLIRDVDTVDKDYQLIILVDLYAFPKGNDKQATRVYQMLMTKYIQATLLDDLYSKCNLPPMEAAIYFIDSAKQERMLDLNTLADNSQVQESLEIMAAQAELKNLKKAISSKDGDLSDEGVDRVVAKKRRDDEEQILMELFGWTEKTTKKDLSWLLKVGTDDPCCLDFAEIFRDTAYSISKDADNIQVVDIALAGVREPMESTRYISVDKFPVYSLVCNVNRDNEQSMIEGFFCMFANIFTCVQEKKLQRELIAFEKDQIRLLLVDALKKYSYFGKEENITVEYEPLEKVFSLRQGIYERSKKEAHKNSPFKDKSDEEIAELIMSETEGKPNRHSSRKLHGLDKNFYNILADIMDHYDPELIRNQNNRIVQSCLEGLWDWRDKQNRRSFRATIGEILKAAVGGKSVDPSKRDKLEFLVEDHQKECDRLINEVTDAEHKLAGNQNKLHEAQKLMTQYGDWMRKGRIYWVSLLGAVFTVLATVFPFFYTEYTAGVTGLGFQVNLLTLIGFCAFLYAIAASIYITYINRKKVILINELSNLRIESERERKKSIAALYRYYTNTILEAECMELLWQDILRRDQENARKGIKRNFHIRRLKMLSEEVLRFITMLKLDVQPNAIEADQQDLDRYAKEGLRLRCEDSCYEAENRRIYCFLPEDLGQAFQKGGTEEA